MRGGMTVARNSNLLSGVLGGLVVLVIGGVLIATGVIDTGSTTREVVRQDPVSRPAANNSGGRTVADIYREEGAGVVFVEARGVSSGTSIFGEPNNQGTATGSGFVVDKNGTILTNAHVVEGAKSVGVRFSENGDLISADVKGRDVSSDLAVLKIDGDKVKGRPIPLGSSSDVQVGDPVVAIGNPFGFTRTVTTGIVSAKQRQITAPNGFPIRNVLQTDASINPGNSGGPLLDSDGRVIGINSQIATGGSSGSVGIGFAIPIDTAKKLLPKLRQGGSVQRAYLGIQMTDLTNQLARDLNLPTDKGALIQEVVPGGPAADAGLHGGRTPVGNSVSAGGDLIVKVDGKAVRNSDGVANAVDAKKPGDTLTIEYYRGHKRRSAKVKLGKRPNNVTQDQGGTTPPGGGLFPSP
jgi:S1-C subfamily serine protease